jgi:hypothetical protein
MDKKLGNNFLYVVRSLNNMFYVYLKSDLSSLDDKKIMASIKHISLKEHEFYKNGVFYLLTDNCFFEKSEYSINEFKNYLKMNKNFNIFYKDTFNSFYYIKFYSSLTDEEYKNKFDLINKDDYSSFFPISQNVGTIEEFEKIIF